MAGATDFAKLVPGFDFLQGLLKGAGAALPNMGQWIAPTLDPQELDKRIEQLKTVQFWLEQNVRMLGATIQALEVQRMTLSTLKTMNVPVADLAEAFKVRMPDAAATFMPGGPAAAAAAPARPAAEEATGARTTRSRPKRSAAGRAGAPAAAEGAAGAPLVDPMQWWGALTQQFSQLASRAISDSAAAAGPLVQRGAAAAGEAARAAVKVAAQAGSAAAAASAGSAAAGSGEGASAKARSAGPARRGGTRRTRA